MNDNTKNCGNCAETYDGPFCSQPGYTQEVSVNYVCEHWKKENEDE